MIGDRFNSYD